MNRARTSRQILLSECSSSIGLKSGRKFLVVNKGAKNRMFSSLNIMHFIAVKAK